MANDVLDMHDELQQLRAEVEDLREYKMKYIALLDADIAHGAHMMGGLLQLAMKPGVLGAIAAANAAEETT
jgi:hypothetical protein